MNGPFLWGSGGQQLTPEQKRRMVADALMGGQNVKDPFSGAAMMVNALNQRNEMLAQNSGFPQAPKTMGNLFGLGNMFRAPTSGGGLY